MSCAVMGGRLNLLHEWGRYRMVGCKKMIVGRGAFVGDRFWEA